jgi:hypothetical protein
MYFEFRLFTISSQSSPVQSSPVQCQVDIMKQPISVTWYFNRIMTYLKMLFNGFSCKDNIPPPRYGSATASGPTALDIYINNRSNITLAGWLTFHLVSVPIALQPKSESKHLSLFNGTVPAAGFLKRVKFTPENISGRSHTLRQTLVELFSATIDELPESSFLEFSYRYINFNRMWENMIDSSKWRRYKVNICLLVVWMYPFVLAA